MGRPGEGDRVEIELVDDHADASPFARGGSTGTVADRPGTDQRTVVFVLAVGVVALALGWVLGRAGDDEGSTSPPPATTDTSDATDVSSDPVDTIATVPTTRVEVSTTSTTTGTTTSATGQTAADPAGASPASGGSPDADSIGAEDGAIVESEVELAEGLRGQPIEVVAYGNGRRLFELDLRSSTLRAREITTQPFGRTRLLVAPDWVLFPSSDPTFPSTLVFRSGPVQDFSAGSDWQILGVADDASLWGVFASPNPRGETIVQRRSVTGELTGDVAFVPATPLLVDPAGGLIVDLPGATVGVMPQPSRRVENTGASQVVAPVTSSITTGRLLALGAELAVAEECTPELACTQVVIDRPSGERRVLGERPDASGGLAAYALVGSSSISPDRSRAVVEVLEPFNRAATQRGLGLLDLTTGELIEIGPAQDVDEATWTPDSRFVLFVQGGRVVAYDTTTDTTTVVARELVAVDAFGVRPVDPQS